MKVKYNNREYEANYNQQTGYYEIELEAPLMTGGIYQINVEFIDLFGNIYTDTKDIQVLAKQKEMIKSKTRFMWIFDSIDFHIKDIVELSDYEISIDEETNSNTIVNILKRTNAKADDIVIIKNDEDIFWGVIKEIKNEDGKMLYKYMLKYITNIFDQKVVLRNEEVIKNTGVEDFIAKTIKENFISNTDTFLNKTYLKIVVKTHTKVQTTVDNVQDGIYNLYTWMTNCTQKYNIVYDFSIESKMLVLTIENKEMKKELIDTTAQAISNYTEVFETSIISKVTVLTKEEGEYNLYLLNDRTTTTDMNNENRAAGKVETVYTEKMEDAPQKALDTMKANRYNHNITFKMKKYLKVGTPVAIKTANSVILDTYISALKITQSELIEYTCGNIRVKFIDKLLKERKENNG